MWNGFASITPSPIIISSVQSEVQLYALILAGKRWARNQKRARLLITQSYVAVKIVLSMLSTSEDLFLVLIRIVWIRALMYVFVLEIRFIVNSWSWDLLKVSEANQNESMIIILSLFVTWLWFLEPPLNALF